MMFSTKSMGSIEKQLNLLTKIWGTAVRGCTQRLQIICLMGMQQNENYFDKFKKDKKNFFEGILKEKNARKKHICGQFVGCIRRKKEKVLKINTFSALWRRDRDSNPRTGISRYAISSRAP